VGAAPGRPDEAWMQAADVIVARHRSRLRARRWAGRVRRRYPGCSVALGWHPTGRWCVVAVAGLPRAAGTDDELAALGRAVFAAWAHWQVRRRLRAGRAVDRS
jgi:hypothetical protein